MKISIDDYLKFDLDFHKGKYPNLRYGQAFMNILLPNEVCPDIFYEENYERCVAKIQYYYIDLGNFK